MALTALAAGMLVGVIYGLLGVRSPAPPAIALVGLLGMLLGEQVVPLARRVIEGAPITRAWFASECKPRITGLPADAPSPYSKQGDSDASDDRHQR